MKTEWQTGPRSGRNRRAFSLLEVMVAIGVFFLAVFAILSLVSTCLENARRLRRPMVDAGTVAAELSLTNKLVEGLESGDLSDFLGKQYRGYKWTYAISEVQSNRLFQADFIVQSPDAGKPVVSKISTLFYSPHSPAGSKDGATTAR